MSTARRISAQASSSETNPKWFPNPCVPNGITGISISLLPHLRRGTLNLPPILVFLLLNTRTQSHEDTKMLQMQWQRAESREQRAKSKEQRAESKEQRAESRERRAKSLE
jgi:hypothetical protein